MKTVCCVYTKDFRNLYKTHKLQGGENLGESIYLLLFDFAYNVRLKEELENVDHDVLYAKDMKAFCDFAEYVLKCRVHRNIFCSTVQFVS